MPELGDQRLPGRFWSKVTVDDATGCWEWTGAKGKGGYGHLMWPVRGKTDYAHRVSYRELVGPIPEGLVIDHLCRNRACCNPAHLEAVTQRRNNLRGEGIASTHASRTHCPQGHAYEGDNVYAYRNRHGNVLRYCVSCRRARARAAARAREAA